MDEQVLILDIDGIEKQFQIDSLPVTIGRYSENRIVLPYDYVSGEHGEMFFKAGELHYRDLNSTNGTYFFGKNRLLRAIQNQTISLEESGVLIIGREDGPKIKYRLESIQKRTKIDAEKCFREGYNRLKEKDFHTAMLLFEKIIDTYPHTPEAYYYAAFAASNLDQLETAVLRLEQYLTLRPHDQAAVVDLGMLYERKGDLDKACARYQKAIELNPNDQAIQKRLKNLKRYEPVSAAFQKDKSTEEVLGGKLVDTVTTRHFIVKYNIARHGRRVNDVLKVLEEAYATVGNHLDIYPSDHVQVELNTGSHNFNGIQSLTDAAGTSSKKGINVILSSRTTLENLFLKVLLIHEYVHFLIDSIVPDGCIIPWWLHEGIAQYESQNLTAHSEAMMADLSKEDSFIPLQVLENGIQGFESKDLIQLAYAQAYSAVDYIIDTRGQDAIKTVLKGLSDGIQPGKALERVGIDYDTLETDWRIWLEGRLKRGQKGRTRKIR